MAENLYQARKTGNELIAMARQIFGSPAYSAFFRVIAISRIQDANGKDVSLKIEIHLPGNPKVQEVRHISVLGYKPDVKSRWPIMLRHEAEATKKKMRMMKSRAKQVKSLDDVPA